MFRKIVSNLSFSPALVGQLGFYAKRLRKEEATRRLGLIFTSLALVVQFFAVFQPPQAANAASSADFIPGGVSSVKDFLRYYDNNSNNIKSILTSLGIKRSEIKSAKYTVIGEASRYNWSMTSLYSYAQGQRSYKYDKLGGGTGTVYYRPMRLTQEGGDKHPVFAAYSQAIGWFAIKKDCGNLITAKTPPVVNPAAQCKALAVDILDRSIVSLSGSASTEHGAKVKGYTFTVKNSAGNVVKKTHVSSSKKDVTIDSFSLQPGTYSASVVVHTSIGNKTNQSSCVANFTIQPPQVCAYNPELQPDSPDCQPCPGDSTIWIKDEKCQAELINSKTATNMTRGNVNATTTFARPGDKISYTITVTNQGKAPQTTTIQESLEDVLEYSVLIDRGGGTFNTQTKTLSWPQVTIEPGAKQSRTIVVQTDSPIPATNTGTSNATSYDCTMTNTFGNSIDVRVKCPTQKVVEQTVSELPHTGPRENMIFAGVFFAVVVYFYSRSRQLGKELRLVRRDLNTGAI